MDNLLYKEMCKKLLDMRLNDVILGLLFSWFIAILIGEQFAEFTRRIQKKVVRHVDLIEIDSRIKNLWKKAMDIDDELTHPNRWLGRFEITLFFICLLFFKLEGIAAWLVFKVATKWDTWNHIIKVPKDYKSETLSLDEFEYLELRNKFATAVSQKFLIGTIGNILAAIIGMGIFLIVVSLVSQKDVFQVNQIVNLPVFWYSP